VIQVDEQGWNLPCLLHEAIPACERHGHGGGGTRQGNGVRNTKTRKVQATLKLLSFTGCHSADLGSSNGHQLRALGLSAADTRDTRGPAKGKKKATQGGEQKQACSADVISNRFQKCLPPSILPPAHHTSPLNVSFGQSSTAVFRVGLQAARIQR